MARSLPALRGTRVPSLGWEDLLEKEMATHSSILNWRIPWMEEHGRPQSMGHKESDTTECLHFQTFNNCRKEGCSLMRVRIDKDSGGNQCRMTERKWALALLRLCQQFWFYITYCVYSPPSLNFLSYKIGIIMPTFPQHLGKGWFPILLRTCCSTEIHT